MRLSVAHVEVVHGCQLRCVGCINSITKPKIVPTSLEDVRRIFSNIDCVESVALLRLFNYGEPILHPELPAVIEIARTVPNWKVGCLELSTNGQFKNRSRLSDIIRTRGVDTLIVSCDGNGTPEDYEKLRPPGKWTTLMSFMTDAAELRDEFAPKMALIARSCVKRGSDMRRWREALPKGWVPEFRGWMALPDAPNVTGLRFKQGKGSCYFVQGDQLYVDSDGMVIPCCAHPRAAELGSLMDTPLSEIWPEQAVFSKSLEERREGVCARCEFGPKENPGQSYEGLTSML